MMERVTYLLIIVAVGVIIANMISNSNIGGTKTLFCQLGNFWSLSVGGMLGQQQTQNVQNC